MLRLHYATKGVGCAISINKNATNEIDYTLKWHIKLLENPPGISIPILVQALSKYDDKFLFPIKIKDSYKQDV